MTAQTFGILLIVGGSVVAAVGFFLRRRLKRALVEWTVSCRVVDREVERGADLTSSRGGFQTSHKYWLGVIPSDATAETYVKVPQKVFDAARLGGNVDLSRLPSGKLVQGDLILAWLVIVTAVALVAVIVGVLTLTGITDAEWLRSSPISAAEVCF